VFKAFSNNRHLRSVSFLHNNDRTLLPSDLALLLNSSTISHLRIDLNKGSTFAPTLATSERLTSLELHVQEMDRDALLALAQGLPQLSSLTVSFPSECEPTHTLPLIAKSSLTQLTLLDFRSSFDPSRFTLPSSLRSLAFASLTSAQVMFMAKHWVTNLQSLKVDGVSDWFDNASEFVQLVMKNAKRLESFEFSWNWNVSYLDKDAFEALGRHRTLKTLALKALELASSKCEWGKGLAHSSSLTSLHLDMRGRYALTDALVELACMPRSHRFNL
jgi:hypothetical protein